MTAKSNKSRRENSSLPYSKILIGSVVGIILFFVFNAFFALLSLKTGSDSSLYKPVGMFIGALSGLIAGFVSVKPIKEKGALFGFVSGLIISLVISIILFAVNNAAAGKGIFILIGLTVLGSVTGGITAVNLKLKKKY